MRNLWFCEGRILNSLSLIRARFLSPDGWDSCDDWKAVIDRENQPAWHSKDSELKEFRLFRIQSLSRYFLCLYSPCCRQYIKACHRTLVGELCTCVCYSGCMAQREWCALSSCLSRVASILVNCVGRQTLHATI